MRAGNFVLPGSSLVLTGAILLCSGLWSCDVTVDPATVYPAEVAASTSAVRCDGQYDKLVTSDYYGASVEPQDPTDIHHAAAAELLYSEENSSKEGFAVAWVSRNDKKIYFRRWDTYLKQFMGGAEQLGNTTSPAGWIDKLGFDESCTVISGGATTCAWFTWEDAMGYVRWGAVGAHKDSTPYATYDPYTMGFEPSGEQGQRYLGWGQWQRQKLIAYIKRGGDYDRRQVRVMLLDNAGQPQIDRLLHTATGAFKAYQTAVAYSTRDERWLVAWTENAYPSPTGGNGRIHVRYVNFDWTLGPDPVDDQPIMGCDPCEGGSAATSSILPRENTFRICKNIWLASSYYSTLTDGEGVVKDRYRLNQYGCSAEIKANGSLAAIYHGPTHICTNWCAITEAAFRHGPYLTPFQVMEHELGTTRALHAHVREDSYVTYSAGQVTGNGYAWPQAFRSDGSVAVAVTTNGSYLDPNSGLELTIVDVKRDGCPP